MTDPHDELARVLTQLAVDLLGETSLGEDLDRLARLARHLIPVCSGASIALLVDGEPSTMAVSDRVAIELDMAQYHEAEGPCLTALGGDAIRVAYLPADERFPHFAIGAADQRVVSVLSVPVRNDGSTVGTLNLYSRQADAFDDDDQGVATVLAAEVALAIVHSRFYDQATSLRDELQQQHDEHAVVSMASGVLMALQQCSLEQAEGLLRNAAEANGEAVFDAAHRIIASTTNAGTLDESES